MSKLIFNPEKDIKELEKYGFEYDSINECYVLNVVKNEGGLNGIVIYTTGTVNNYTSCNDESTLMFYKLIKANLIIDEEELKDGFMD